MLQRIRFDYISYRQYRFLLRRGRCRAYRSTRFVKSAAVLQLSLCYNKIPIWKKNKLLFIRYDLRAYRTLYLSLLKSWGSVPGISQNIVPIIMDSIPAMNILEIHRKLLLGCEYAMWRLNEIINWLMSARFVWQCAFNIQIFIVQYYGNDLYWHVCSSRFPWQRLWRSGVRQRFHSSSEQIRQLFYPLTRL